MLTAYFPSEFLISQHEKIQIKKFLLNDLFTLVLAPDSHRNTTAAGKFCFTFTQKMIFFLEH